MSGGARHLAGVLTTCMALGLAACGSSEEPEGDPLPAAATAELINRLEEIERRYRDGVEDGNVGACDQIGTDSLKAVREIITGLPQGVDPDLRRAVRASFDRLRELTAAGCADIEPPETTPAPEPVPLPEPEPETTPEEEDEDDDETSTEQAPPQPTTPTTPPADPNAPGGTPAPGQGQGGGGGAAAPGQG